jgi:hypothetical protein
MLKEQTRAGTQPIRAPGPRRRSVRRRRAALGAGAVALVLLVVLARGGEDPPPPPQDVRGSPAWAVEHYGDPDEPDFEDDNIVEIDFLGRAMFVHRAAERHFLRLERIFEARAPVYAAGVAEGELDDWSYLNRSVRGGDAKSSHAFGIAVDINATTNVLGTRGDMPEEVVAQWEAEGGRWGGNWTRPDPMHFETHLTPEEIRRRYRADGTPRPWYLDRLTGG